ncbi:MAG: rhodanese-like domain-containing protein [Anaerolineae bacterium]|nr:rhodanese-like domain-containing protein [Anaerolineae bacterium]
MSKSARKKRAEVRAHRKASQTKTGIVIGSIVIVLVIAAVVALVTGGAGQISVAEASEKQDQGAFILDVREPDEWEEYHIPGSTLIPLEELAARIGEVPSDQEVVVVCRTGNRSRQGREILNRAGFTNVSSMRGGLQVWAAQGYPTVSGP